MSETSDHVGLDPLRVVRVLRSAGAALVAQLALHGQLAKIEWAEEKQRLLKMCLAGVIGFACLLCVMVFAGASLLVACWDTVYRVPAVLAVTIVYVISLCVAVYRLQKLAAQGENAFVATREEIAADMALLKSRL